MSNRHKITKSSSISYLHTDINSMELQKKNKKVSSRRPSMCNLTHSLDQQIEQLQSVNQNLTRENNQLKQKVIFYERREAQRNPTKQSKTYQHAIKDIVNNKLINRTKCSSRIMTECETGIMCSKDVSLSWDSLQSVYDSFKKGIIPQPDNFRQLLDGCIQQLQQNYVKMKLISEGIQKQYPDLQHQQLLQKIQLYKIPALYKKNPKVVMHSLSKSKAKQDEILEMFSAQETITKLQKIVSKIMKSRKIINMLRTNLLMHKFAKQILDVR